MTRGVPDHELWPQFIMPWDDTTPGPTDMSFLLHKPAGNKGFIQVVDGHLATGDGERWRMWSLNLCTDIPMPPMDVAPKVARRLAKFGVNCVRLHAIDQRWPNGILMRDRTDPMNVSGVREGKRSAQSTRVLDPEALARMDYFIACCKAEGVYVDLNLNVARWFSEGDGVMDGDRIGWGKGATFYDPQLIALQKEYAAQLLDHVNPFTGLRYADEPAIAIVELVNENSLSERWRGGTLQGQTPGSTGRGWSDIPPSYARELDEMWNAWLAKRYADRSALQEAWGGDLGEYENPAQGTVRRTGPKELEASSTGRYRDELTFYMEVEQGFFVEMKRYLRGELGIRQLLLGTSDHGHSWSGLSVVEADATLDVVDGHIYWQHPSRTHGIVNSPMVDQPDASAPAQLSRSAVAGKPYIVSECNEPFPNDYAAEFIPILAAYALLQDWDGISFYDYDGRWNSSYWYEERWRQAKVGPHFELSRDPVQMPQLAQGALTFLRGDVRAAEKIVERTATRDWVLDSVRRKVSPGRPYWLEHLPGRLALVHRTRLAALNADAVTPVADEVSLPAGTIASDTGELTWIEGSEALHQAGGRVQIDAPRCQAVIGRAGTDATQNVIVDLETAFAAVQVSSLDDAPIASAERLLLVTGARIANQGMRWAGEGRHALEKQGTGPTLIEPVVLRLTLRGLEGANAVVLQPLDGHGQPMGEERRFARQEEGFVIRLAGEPPTPWYLICVDRS